MFGFTRQKNVPKTFEDRLFDLETVVGKLKRDVLNNSMDIDTMRDKVLRKIQTRKDVNKDKEDKGSSIADGLDDIREISNKAD